MTILSISHQGPSTSISVENWGTGGGILQGVPPNVINDLVVSQETRKKYRNCSNEHNHQKNAEWDQKVEKT
jgi:hypothetical protein